MLKPLNKSELISLINEPSVQLANIDTAAISDMSELFYKSQRTDFSGIASWDVSSVQDMSYMFEGSAFNQALCWHAPKLRYARKMFAYCRLLNAPIVLNEARLKDAAKMFCGCFMLSEFISVELLRGAECFGMFYMSPASVYESSGTMPNDELKALRDRYIAHYGARRWAKMTSARSC